MLPKNFTVPNINHKMSMKEFNVPKLFNLHTNSSENNKPFPSSKLPGNEFALPSIFHKNLNERNVKVTNFIIPKLTSTSHKLNFSEPNLDMACIKNENSSEEFGSLSELVSNHLNNAPVKCETDFSKNKRTYSDKKTGLIKSISKMAKLQLSDIKSLSSVEHESPVTNGWHIDLSVALKTANSLPSVSNYNQKDSLEKFDIPFVECDGQKILPNEKLLPCNFDISSILLVSLKYQKYPSSFGKTLCLRYKRPRSGIKKLNDDDVYLSKIKRFNFNIPSPDDIISSHLRR